MGHFSHLAKTPDNETLFDLTRPRSRRVSHLAKTLLKYIYSRVAGATGWPTAMVKHRSYFDYVRLL